MFAKPLWTLSFWVAVLLTLLVCATPSAVRAEGAAADEMLQVHLVPHTHDDVGWLKTVDQYYMGSNNSIQHAGVQYILDSIIPELKKDPSRKFIYVEIAFFERWWREQSETTKTDVKALVASGQLEFINGGWCMNDEASTHYSAIIDQMARGHSFLKENFGVVPRIGWHIDPFGHSAEQASMFASMGFDAFFFARIDYDDKIKRLQDKTLEMVWRGSKSLGASTDMFTSVLYAHYSPPPGFCFDQRCTDPPIQDDPNLFDMNIRERAETLAAYSKDTAKHFTHNHIMFTMGDDFEYENANMWYKNLDKLIQYFKAHPELGINAFYSTPSIYVDAVNALDLEWTLKTDDFFPYADNPWAYWTGYFISRPALKGYVRKMSDYLQVCNIYSSIANTPNASSKTDVLERALAVAQHHDAVSGTEKQHVQDDYAKRLAMGEASCDGVILNGVGEVISKGTSDKPAAATFVRCPLRNETICGVDFNDGSVVAVTVTSATGKYNQYIRLPVASNASFTVLDSNQQPVDSYIVPVSRLRPASRPYALVFKADLAGKLTTTYFVQLTSFALRTPSVSVQRRTMTAASAKPIPLPGSTDTSLHTFSAGQYSLGFDTSTGRLASITSKVGGDTTVTRLSQQGIMWYNASIGNSVSGQRSGAYIFRPNSSTAFPVTSGRVSLIPTYAGGYVEIKQTFASWAKAIWRLYPDTEYVEVEYEIGPIPFKDGLGREVITRFDTDIDSDATWFTDANGREFQERIRNYRETWKYNNTEPISGNYYPTNAAAYIQDQKAGRQFTMATDRSVGCTSMQGGSLECMIHRRLLHDDGRGVGEPLNETGIDGDGLVIRTVHRIVLAPASESMGVVRPLMEQIAHPPTVLFASFPSVDGFMQSYVPETPSLFSYPSPAISVQRFKAGTQTILRLAHLYAVGEVAKDNVPVVVDIRKLFNPAYIGSVTSVVELSLSANQPLSNVNRLKWKVADSSTFANDRRDSSYVLSPLDGFTVTVQPMEIRTFEITTSN